MFKDNKYLIPIMLIVGVIIWILGGTLAYWNWQSSNAQKTEVTFTVGSDFSCGINGGGSITTRDRRLIPTDCTNSTYAIKKEVTTSITNTGSSAVKMNLNLKVDHIDTAFSESENLRYALTTESNSCTAGIISTGTFTGKSDGDEIALLHNVTQTGTYYLYVWLDKAETNSATMDKNLDLSLTGDCTNNEEVSSCPISTVSANDSTPNAPVLDPGMIPVTIADNGTVTTVSSSDSSWYDYQNKKWANAVLVKESGVKTREQNKVAGTTINQDDILAYYVWIPRYKYAIPEPLTCGCIPNVNDTDYQSCYDLTDESLESLLQFIIDEDGASDSEEAFKWYENNSQYYIEWYNEENDSDLETILVFDRTINYPRTIDIVFENGTPSKSTGTATGTSYYTHPAFTFGTQELSGIWVGKFEITGNVDTPTILPNSVSLVNQTLDTRFQTTLKFAGGTLSGSTVTFSSINTYGLTSSDSHMMKNSEWGAVAYLSHSNYGINSEIRINNYAESSRPYNTLTGCGASENNVESFDTCDITYGTVSSYPQSTTGNISGIFDMSGGADETVMGNYNNTAGSHSGFVSMPNAKYFDNYPASVFKGTGVVNGTDNLTFCTLATCGGHALNETANWYGDYAFFVYSSSPWFDRGGSVDDSSYSGIFNFMGRTSYPTLVSTCRGVLVTR